MGLERLVGFAATATAGVTFVTIGYGSFREGKVVEALTYSAASLIAFLLTGVCYRSYKNITSNQETGVFGVPDQVIRAIEERDSGRYHRL